MAASPRQISFVQDLLRDRVVGDCLRVEAEEAIERGTGREVSAIIDRLKECPFPARERAAGQNPRIEVAEGRYALPSDFDPEGTPVFYRVDHGAEGGKWEGYIFLSRLVGPNEAPIKDRDERTRILSQIAGERVEALRRYGHLSNHCGNCNLELTDKFSRFVGVGPVCREKLGLPKSEAAFVRDGGILPDEYLREVAAEEEAALRAAEAGLPAGAPGSRHPFGQDELAEINERSGAAWEAEKREAEANADGVGGLTSFDLRADGRPVNTGNGDLRALAARFGAAA